MKKILCYLGILVLLGLTILPPMLRVFMPDQGEEEEEVVKIESVALACTSDKYMVNTNYKNNKVQMIVIKKIINIDESNTEETEESSENVIETEMDMTFQALKEYGDIVYNVLNDGEAIKLDFSISNHEKLNLSTLTKLPEDQKTYYESQGLTCIIRR